MGSIYIKLCQDFFFGPIDHCQFCEKFDLIGIHIIDAKIFICNNCIKLAFTRGFNFLKNIINKF